MLQFMDDLDLGPRLLERALDDAGELPTDPFESRRIQARAAARLDPVETDALVLDLFAAAPPSIDAPRRSRAESWIALRDELIEQQGLRESPDLG